MGPHSIDVPPRRHFQESPTILCSSPPLYVHVAQEGTWCPWMDQDFFHAQALQALFTQSIKSTPWAPLASWEVSLLVTDDEGIQKLNKTYRHKDAPTNVLSFPLHSLEELRAACQKSSAPQGPLVLGDIVVSWQRVAEEATARHIPWSWHLTHLLLHGFLHLLGYDHETEEEARVMEDLEIHHLRDLKYHNPYW